MSMQRYFAAMYASSFWFDAYEHLRDGLGLRKEGRNMRIANYCRARGVVLLDRVLNDEVSRYMTTQAEHDRAKRELGIPTKGRPR